MFFRHRVGRRTDTREQGDFARPRFSAYARRAPAPPNRRMFAADIFWRKLRNSRIQSNEKARLRKPLEFTRESVRS